MLRLALKAFSPDRPSSPFLHVDTTWKFREMYAFRDRMAAEHSLEMLVHVNRKGLEMGTDPFVHGLRRPYERDKTEALKQALEKHGFDAAVGGHAATRSARGPRNGSSPSVRSSTAGIPSASVPSCSGCTTAGSDQRSRSGCSRSPTGPSSTCGSTSTWSRSRSCPFTSPRKDRLRLPVQWVNRPDPDFRGFAGMLVAGSVSPGDQIVVEPSARRSAVARVVTYDGDLDCAVAGQSVTLTLNDKIDVSRGEVIADIEAPRVSVSGSRPRSCGWRRSRSCPDAAT